MVVSTSNACEIYSVTYKNSFRWKWRYTNADGATHACLEEYSLFFDCAAAARASGYEPRSDWTGPCALIMTLDRRPTNDGCAE
jgi:hypothetical protein